LRDVRFDLIEMNGDQSQTLTLRTRQL
jgi:hypothetical protein